LRHQLSPGQRSIDISDLREVDMRNMLILALMLMMAGCSQEDVAPVHQKQETGHEVTEAHQEDVPDINREELELQVDGLVLDMSLKQFRKMLPEIEVRPRKNGAKRADLPMKSYMGIPVREVYAIFWEDRLVEFRLKTDEGHMARMVDAFKKVYGAPDQEFHEAIRGIIWKRPNGQHVNIIFPEAIIYYSQSQVKYADMMVKRMMGAVDLTPVYKAEINCRAAGRTLPLLGCVMDSGIKVHNGANAELYDIRRLGRTPSLKLSLQEHFSIQARNSASSPYITLHITIRDRIDDVVFQDVIRAGSWLNVGN